MTTIGYDHVYPYDEASFASASTTPASASAVGFNAGIDIGFFFSEVVGVGAIIRYSGGPSSCRAKARAWCRSMPAGSTSAADCGSGSSGMSQ